MTQNRTLVEEIYSAFDKGDIPAVLGFLKADAQWTEAAGGPYGGIYIGPDAVLENVFMKIGAEWDSFTADRHEFICEEDTVIARGEYSATYKATGKSFRAPFAHVWKFDNGKVASFHQYTDTAAHLAPLESS